MDHHRHTRIRYTAGGALAALLAVGAIAAAGAFAGTSGTSPKPPVRVTGPAQSVPAPLQSAVQQLVAKGTITAAQAQTLGGDIRAGTVHPDQLTAQGFTPAQAQAIQQALQNTKRQIAQASHSS